MALSDELSTEVANIINTPWNLRQGRQVPSTSDVALSGGAVEIDATFLYADLVNSSKIAQELDRRVASKIYKAFLAGACRIIKSSGGTIVSFDGDRVLGIFHGNSKNSAASTCGRKIKYLVAQIIRPKFENKYDSVKNATFTLKHGVGIDTGTVLGIRAGVRGSNDLVWVGRPPNLAAKLSDIRESTYSTYITSSVYNRLNDSAKFGGENDENMWEIRSLNYLGENITIYRSSWWRRP